MLTDRQRSHGHRYSKFHEIVSRFFGPTTQLSTDAQQMSRRSSGLGRTRRACSIRPIHFACSTLARRRRTTFASSPGAATGSTARICCWRRSIPSLRIKDEEGKPVIDTKRFLEENLAYSAAHFDVVFAWNLPDYMDEELVKPVIDRLWSTLKPGGMLLAFFHTRDAGPDAPCYRFHITGNDSLDMQEIKLPATVSRSLQFCDFACSAFLTTVTSRICFAISRPSSSSWPATTCVKFWSCASPHRLILGVNRRGEFGSQCIA